MTGFRRQNQHGNTLVVEPYPSEKPWSSSVGVVKFPTEWKNKIHVPNHQPVESFKHEGLAGENQQILIDLRGKSSCDFAQRKNGRLKVQKIVTVLEKHVYNVLFFE